MVRNVGIVRRKASRYLLYLRFLNSFVPSFSVMYSKPVSISDVALHVLETSDLFVLYREVYVASQLFIFERTRRVGRAHFLF